MNLEWKENNKEKIGRKNIKKQHLKKMKNKRERKQRKGKWRALRAKPFEDKMVTSNLNSTIYK